jgi:alkaline phosphatase D
MSEFSSRRAFLVTTGSSAAALAVSSTLVACGGSSALACEFKYGVASGDPLADRVMLWTHAKAPNSNADVGLTWQVASDSSFASIVGSGKLRATAASSYTAKVDVTGLTAGTTYFYRFIDDTGVTSTVGTTRTLPAANVASVKFAVFSCALYSEGFFNAYDAAAKSDAQYAIHLGDYIYEYGSDPKKFGNTDAITLGRVTAPANDIVSLDDYRTRYALYRGDASLQALHARMPWITVWDDHEFANNAWVGGAENHNTATQGDWATRKALAAQAYHEWMPIRPNTSGSQLKIYRSFDFGSLFSLHMLDTRIEGRDRQYDNFGDADGGVGRYVTGLTSGTDATRRMISAEQQSWLTSTMSASKATWQFLGNQDIMARMWFPASVLQAYAAAATNPAAVPTAISAFLTAKATRAAAGAAALSGTQAGLLSTTLNPRIPYNLDSWDGYPMQREALLQTAKAQGKKLVALSGDSHNAWFANLTTLAGDKVGVEFAASSVTAPGFESAGLGAMASSLDGSALVPQLGNAAVGAGLGLIDDLNYSDSIRRGYLLMTVTADAVKGDYVFMSTVKSATYTASVGRSISVTAAGAISYA